MKPAVLFLADPLKSLNPTTDSSLALAEGALDLGYLVFWATADDVELINGSVVVKNSAKITHIDGNGAFELATEGVSDSILLTKFKKILIRKDPPFNESYTDLCWLLSQLPADIVINTPQALLLNHEKLMPWSSRFSELLPSHSLVPTLVSKRPASLLDFAQEQFSNSRNFLQVLSNEEEFTEFRFRVLTKPWRGHGGRNIQSFHSLEELKEWISRISSKSDAQWLAEPWMIQPFLPEIFLQGDRRVFIVNGEIVFDFVRFPKQGRIEANLAQGGEAKLIPMTSDLRELASKIALKLKNEGILIAGLDFIGDRLTEINITSPTGIRTFEKLSGTKIARQIMNKILNG